VLCEGKIADLALVTVEDDQFWTDELLDLQFVDVPELQVTWCIQLARQNVIHLYDINTVFMLVNLQKAWKLCITAYTYIQFFQHELMSLQYQNGINVCEAVHAV